MEQEQIIEIIDKREPKQKLIVKNSNIAGSEFNDCFAEDVIFHDISLPGVKISYADLKNCEFRDMNMRNGRISDANLSNLVIDDVNFSGVTIRNAGAAEAPVTFENLNIPGSKIIGCNLTNVELTDCNIEGLKINGILIKELLDKIERE